ncbi:hypothetical protein MiTa_02850 [Microcystis aeruginosa NIES-4264]|nr:hypothetical protein MiTa_02850 [Microcystis aeruginosa NIES-4264]
MIELTVFVLMSELLDGLKSFSLPLTLVVLIRSPATKELTVRLTVMVSPLLRLPKLAVTTPLELVLTLAVALMTFTPDGKFSVRIRLFAVLGPLLVTVRA